MSDNDWSAWPAPAKLNLFLRITGRRPDGYHDLQTFFQVLDWGDTIAVRVRADGGFSRRGPDLGIAESEDLLLRAARLLQEHTNCRLGADFDLTKRIPVGGGLGGGSSDAATVLHALNVLWRVDLGSEQLAELALALGADVPVFVHGHSAWAEGVGERLLPMVTPRHWFVLLDSGERVSTAELFQAPDLTRNATPIKMADFTFGRFGLGNAFEPVLRRRAPRIAQTLDSLSAFAHARLTGTGGVCFAEFVSAEAAQQAARTLEDRGPVWVARGVDRSPLLDVLADRRNG